ncbi:MAG: lysoplasmalogenase [Nevskiaceae bacterium]
MITIALSFAAAAGAAAAIVADSGERRHPAYYALKPLTTLLIIGIATTGPLEGAYTQWVLVALVFSLAGDVFLMFDSERAFVGGLAGFFVAHLAFVSAFMQGVHIPGLTALPAWLVAIGLYAGAMLFVLLPRAGALKVPVLAYCLVLAAMVAAAGVRHGALGDADSLRAVLGALLFMASDSLLGWRRFVGAYRGAQALILSTYWGAIGLIAWSV